MSRPRPLAVVAGTRRGSGAGIAVELTSRGFDLALPDLAPMGHWGCPEDVAHAVASLASGQFTFAAGSVINVDGALSIPRL